MIESKFCNISNLCSSEVWMIHEIDDVLLNKLKKFDKEKVIFIWDDAVLSQYEPIKVLQSLGYTNILAVSTNIANCATYQYTNDSNCIMYEFTGLSHKRFHESNNACAFMTWNHIRELKESGVYIAAHGYNHERLEEKMFPNILIMKHICEQVHIDFLRELNFETNLYVYPFNLKFSWSDELLHSYRMDTIGKGRLDARKL